MVHGWRAELKQGSCSRIARLSRLERSPCKASIISEWGLAPPSTAKLLHPAPGAPSIAKLLPLLLVAHSPSQFLLPPTVTFKARLISEVECPLNAPYPLLRLHVTDTRTDGGAGRSLPSSPDKNLRPHPGASPPKGAPCPPLRASPPGVPWL